jgi:HD-like signal output (HDOD) protein
MNLIDIHDLANKNEPLASLRNTFYKLREVVADPTSGFNDIVEITSIDPSLTLVLLKIVNNAFYGFRVEIDTFSHTLGAEGKEKLMKLVFPNNSDPEI